MTLQILESTNSIIVPLEIKLDKLDDLKKIVQELKEVDIESIAKTGVGSSDQQMAASIEKLLKKVFPQYTEEEKMEKKMKAEEKAREKLLRKFLPESATEGAQDVAQLITNPKGFLLGIISNPYVATALVAAGLGKVMLDYFMLQGNILDKHFKRIIAKEQLAGLRRQQRKQTQTGLGRQVIFTSHSGSNEPEYAFNSFEARRSGAIDSMTAFQIRRGYKF